MHSIKKFSSALLAVTLLLIINGCTLLNLHQTDPGLPQNLTPEERADYLEKLDYWSLTGRIGIITNEESNTANIYWQKNDDKLKLRIYGSLGTTYALLTSEPGKAKIELSDDQVYYGSNAEQLLFRTTGWRIPVDQMQHWILGLTQNAPQVELNEQQYPKLISFADWRMTFRSYRSFYGMTMPKKVNIKHPDVTLKFSIHDWELAKPQS